MGYGDHAVIGMAQGILMARYGFDSSWAMVWMLAQADDLGLTFEHIAEGLVTDVEVRAHLAG